MKNKKVLIIVTATILVLGAVAGGTYYWWIGTPEYSLSELRSAYATHDAEKALKYIDIDSAFDNFWTEFQKKNLEQLSKSSDGFEQLGYFLGQGMMEGMKPTLKQGMKAAIETSIKSATSTGTSTNKYDELSFASKYSLTRIDKNTVLIEIPDHPLKFKLTKTPERYWRIVAIEGLIEDEATTTTATSSKTSI